MPPIVTLSGNSPLLKMYFLTFCDAVIICFKVTVSTTVIFEEPEISPSVYETV